MTELAVLAFPDNQRQLVQKSKGDIYTKVIDFG
jgi:hypothetical protein